MQRQTPNTPTTTLYSDKQAIIDAANAQLKAITGVTGETKTDESKKIDLPPQVIQVNKEGRPLPLIALNSQISFSFFATTDRQLFIDKETKVASPDVIFFRKAQDSNEYKAYLPLFQISAEFEKLCNNRLKVFIASKKLLESYENKATQLRNAIFRIEKPFMPIFLAVDSKKYSDDQMRSAHVLRYADGLKRFRIQLMTPQSDILTALIDANQILAELNGATPSPNSLCLITKCLEIFQQYDHAQQAPLATQHRR